MLVAAHAKHMHIGTAMVHRSTYDAGHLLPLPHHPTCQDLLDLCELPLLVAQRAGGARLEPALDAVQVEHVPAAAPGDAQPGVVGVACRLGAGGAAWRAPAAAAGSVSV